MGKRNWQEDHEVKVSATRAHTLLWACPNYALHLYVAQARGLLSVYKSMGFVPLTCAQAAVDTPVVGPGRAAEDRT